MVDTFGIAAGAGLAAQAQRAALKLDERRLGLQEKRLGLDEKQRETERKNKLQDRVNAEVKRFTDMAVKLKRIGTPEATEQIDGIRQMLEETLMAADFAGIGSSNLSLRQFDAQVAGTPTLEQETIASARTEARAGGVKRDVLIDEGIAPDDAAQTAFGIQQAPLTEEEEVSRAARIAAAQAQARQAVEGLETDLGKLIEDREKVARVFGEDSDQAKAFDELIRAENAGEEPSLSDVSGMRKEFTRLSAKFIEARDAFRTIQAAADNPDAVGDLALIFAYMKVLDPGSTVRSDEFATAQNAAGVPDQIRNLFNSLRSGERVSVNRQDFVDRAGDFFRVHQRNQLSIEEQFRRIAFDAGMDPDDVVLDFGANVNVPGRSSGLDLTSIFVGGKPVSQLTEQEISNIPNNSLSPEQRRALLARLDELEAANAN